MEFASYEAREDEATVVIGVLRGDDGNQTVTVDYATASLTAIAGTDVCRRWWHSMRELMPSNADDSPQSRALREVFHLGER